MNLSLKNRVAASFIVANLVVLILSFTVFHFLNGLNREMDQITAKSNKISLLTDEIRISAVLILKNQRKVLTKKSTPQDIEKIIGLCDSFTNQLHNLETLYNDPEVKKVVIKMLSYVDSLKLVLSNAALFHRDTVGMSSIAELADKILDAFSEFQDIQYFQSVERDKKIKEIVEETKKNMMITLIIGFLGTIILGLIIPGKIALPFKKIKDAIRELQECNFDVSIYYNQHDEIGEIAQEMNRMIQSIKLFDELRTDRINVENRKFDALANLVRKPVMVANAEGRLIYMNNPLYSLMQVQMADVIGKNIHDTVIPKSIIDAYEKAIKRRSKIENQEIIIPLRKNTNSDEGEAKVVDIVEVEGENEKTLTEVVFKGFGNVIPIRGKESNLDYYIMVLSEDIFT